MSAPRTRLGGFGAVFFIATLGAIAFYVQRQTVPDTHDAVRTAVSSAPQTASEPTPLAALPWQDRLDLAALKPMPIGPAAPPTAKSAGKSSDPDFAGLAQNLGDSRLVQELSDGHRILYTLDPVLQDAALQIFRNREVPYAAAVILDVQDNSVLAMAGHSTCSRTSRSTTRPRSASPAACTASPTTCWPTTPAATSAATTSAAPSPTRTTSSSPRWRSNT